MFFLQSGTIHLTGETIHLQGSNPTEKTDIEMVQIQSKMNLGIDGNLSADSKMSICRSQ